MTSSVKLEARRTQNREPYVHAIYGLGVRDRDRDEVESMLRGYGRSCGYGPGPLAAAQRAARKVARDLEQLGWHVILDEEDDD